MNDVALRLYLKKCVRQNGQKNDQDGIHSSSKSLWKINDK